MPRYANTRQLPSGKWQGRYTGPDKVSHSKLFDSARAASVWVQGEKQDVEQETWIAPSVGEGLTEAVITAWLVSRIDVRPSTRARDEACVRNHVTPAFGALPIAAIDQVMVREWVAQLHAAGLAPATVHKVYQLLSQIMGMAVDMKIIRLSPCYNVPLPKIERDEQRFLTAGEAERLVRAMPNRYRALALLGCYGGLRIGEMAGLERQHVDTARSRVRVIQTAVEVHGQLHIGPLKTDKSRRTVTLPGAVMEVMAEHLRDFTGTDADAPVFPNADGSRLRVNNWRRRVWTPAITAAGVAPLRVHDMRHTAVALWIATGAPVLQVSRRAGHASVSFTLDRYGHLYEEAEETLMGGLGSLLGAAKQAAGDLSGVASVTPLHRAG